MVCRRSLSFSMVGTTPIAVSAAFMYLVLSGVRNIGLYSSDTPPVTYILRQCTHAVAWGPASSSSAHRRRIKEGGHTLVHDVRPAAGHDRERASALHT